MEKTALIVDDDRTERRLIVSVLKNTVSMNFAEAENGRDALRILANDTDGRISLVVMDLEMPVMGGLEALESISRDYPALPVIILTGSTDRGAVVRALKMGAVDFLSKPVESARLDVSARNALKISMMSREISRLRRHAEGTLLFSDLIGHDAGLKESVKTGLKAAACDLPVLVTGETGTGKELFARAIHGESARAQHGFIAVNCGAIPEKLVESTLFGHEKGSFTGAIAKTPGKFLEASEGTIFLDEVGELPPEAQVKLLRVLQQQEVEPVGGTKPVPINVRVISATNRDLARDVKNGRFREDLYFRLNVLPVTLPPLRERKNDIPDLALYFIDQFCASHKTLPKTTSPEALLALAAHEWPGNVREMENTINRAMALCENNRLEAGDFLFNDTAGSAGPLSENIVHLLQADGRFKTYRALEQEILARALSYHGHNMTLTARMLGIAKSTLYTKLEKKLTGRHA